MKKLGMLIAATMLLCGSSFASLTEVQTVNGGVNGSQGWVASFGTAPQQVTTNGYLSVGGIGGGGQFFTMNGKSLYQIVRCTALKSSSWAGFGVTYYDASFNEIGSQQKVITADIRNGDQETLYAIGLVPPSNAVYGYMWVWNNDSNGYVQVDNFRLENYFPDEHADFDGSQAPGDQYTQTFPDRRNLMVNGSFETFEFETDEFWNVVDVNNSVRRERLQIGIAGVSSLRVGSANQADFLYQTIPGVQAGQPYTFEVAYGRLRDDAPAAFAGVDFFDANGNKIGDTVIQLDSTFIFGRFASPVREFRNVTAPNGTAYAIGWAWTAPLGDTDSPLYLNTLSLKTREFEPPTIELVQAPDVTVETSPFSYVMAFRINDNDRLDRDTLDGNDFTVVGPNGTRTVGFRPRNPNIGGGRPLDEYEWSLRGDDLTAADNGTHTIFYTNGEIVDINGNATVLQNTAVGTFQVNIGNVGVE